VHARAVRAAIGLGSNVGDSERAIERACAELARIGTIRARSSLYRSKAWGVVDQPDFVNAAVVLETGLDPRGLLAALKAIEERLGRIPTFRWGPRAIDLDILTYDDRHVAEPDLTIPHERLFERAFALAPLAEIDPAFREALAALPDSARAEVERVDSKMPSCELGRDA
jgi:2-amino-4-hydroxy-6-hydroxymethyldihydropteridine diphosphokinase